LLQVLNVQLRPLFGWLVFASAPFWLKGEAKNRRIRGREQGSEATVQTCDGPLDRSGLDAHQDASGRTSASKRT
jgi:hypothetical protein